MCKADLESPHHLLLHRPFGRTLWDVTFSCLKACWLFLTLLRIISSFGEIISVEKLRRMLLHSTGDFLEHLA